jgi:hypothetical protein
MRRLAEIMVLVVWLIGAAASGLTVEWTDGPFAEPSEAPTYAVTDAFQLAVDDDRVALRVRVPGLPWTMALAAPAPSGLPASLPPASVASGSDAPPDPAPGRGAP